jgi:hypothetical protein
VTPPSGIKRRAAPSAVCDWRPRSANGGNSHEEVMDALEANGLPRNSVRGTRDALPAMPRGDAIMKYATRLSSDLRPYATRRPRYVRLPRRRFWMASAGFEIIPKASIGNPRKNGLDQTDIDPGALWA